VTTSPNADRWYLDIRGEIRIAATQKIVDMLLAGETKVVHRVSRDRAKWHAICNEPTFEIYIQEFIKHLTSEASKYAPDTQKLNDEQSGFHDLKNLKLSINEQLEHAQILQKINYQLHGLRHLLNEISTKKQQIVDLSQVGQDEDQLHDEDRNIYIDAPGKPGLFKNYFNFSDAKIRLRFIVVVVVLGIVSFSTHRYFENKAARLQAENEKNIQDALQAKRLGEYDRAVQIFSNVRNVEALDTNTLVAMADAHVTTNHNQTAAGLLTTALAHGATQSETAAIHTKLAQIFQTDGNLPLARSHFKKAVENDSVFKTLYDFALLELQEKNYQAAEELLLKALAIDGQDMAPVVLALYEASSKLDLIEQKTTSGTTASTPRLDRLNTIIDRVKEQSPAYYDELLVTQIAIASQKNSNELFDFLVKEWLNREPPTPKAGTWEQIHRWCLDVYKNANLSNLKSAFYAGCLTRLKGAQEALPYAQFAYATTTPVIPQLRGFYGYMNFVTGNITGAKQVLRSGDIELSVLGKKALASLCRTHPDPECIPKIKPAKKSAKKN